MPTARAVITAIGMVASNGVGTEAFADAIFHGKSGISSLVSFDAADTGRERAGEVLGFDPAPFLRSKKNYLDRNSALAFGACEIAVRASGLALPDTSKAYGLSLGCAAGNLESLALFTAKVREKGARFASPFLFPHTYFNTTAGLLSIEYGLTGPHGQFCSGGAAGLEAVAYAAQCVEQGRASAMLAGGAEAFSEELFRAVQACGWLSPQDGRDEFCWPFSCHRNGTILGEGAGLALLESPAAASARGADILAVIEGYCVASSVREAMGGAVRMAGRKTSDVRAIFAAAGGYRQEDEEEAIAIADFSDERSPAVTALKGLIGETLGAGGALGLCAAVIAVRRGRLPAVSLIEPAFPLTGWDCFSSAPLSPILVNAGSPGSGHWVSILLSRCADL